MKPKYIIGINYGSHDASVVLYSKGKILFAAEEERYNREKHTKKFPQKSLEYIITKFSLNDESKVYVVYFMNPFVSFIAPLKMFIHYRNYVSLKYGLKKSFKRLKEWFYIKKYCINKNWKVFYVNHHEAHAASSFFLSPFRKATIVTIDGRGEYLSVGFFKAEDRKIQSLGGISIPFSVGYFYSYFTEYLGFKPQCDEYKVMGLSAFGEPTYINILSSIFSYRNNNKPKVDLNVLDFWKVKGENTFAGLIEIFGPKREMGSSISQNHKNIASSLQKYTQTIISNLVLEAIRRAGYKNVCLSGGVGLNCVANSYIAKFKEVEKLFIPPAPNDTGTALGAALIIANNFCPHFTKNITWNPFLGAEYSSSEILAEISKYCDLLEAEFVEDPSLVGAKLLSQGKIIGWFQERMEWGPRALGNRSIFSQAYPISIKDKLNVLIKERETFRPFAPMILTEYLKDYFTIEESLESILNYMLCTGEAKPIALKNIPAALNVDGTARIQTVSSNFNKKCWDLLNHYKKLTGIPAIINTSFNIKGNPIVNTPKDALADFIDSSLDYCIMGSYLIKRKTLA
ncbi:MAG: hypothetical protein JSS63_03545 [Bacteroidetes bacterium]|nr:hypothetical protein [Bacteroidota bacterium]